MQQQSEMVTRRMLFSIVPGRNFAPLNGEEVGAESGGLELISESTDATSELGIIASMKMSNVIGRELI